jgi:hypothetical protein
MKKNHKKEASKKPVHDHSAFYEKYQHVVVDSVKESPKSAHGFLCTVKCTHEGCAKVRVINKQDAFQVTLCKEHKREQQKEARKARRSA